MRLIDSIDRFSSRFLAFKGRINNLSGSSLALYLALRKAPFLMVENTEEQGKQLVEDAAFFARLLKRDLKHCFLPSPDGTDAAGERANIVYKFFINKDLCAVVTSKDAMGLPLWRPESLEAEALRITVSAEMERAEAEERLKSLGYTRVPLVAGKGQYSIRGFILDVFPSYGDTPLRVEFFGDVIENIRLFEVETQRSIADIDGAVIMPAVEPEDGEAPEGLFSGMPAFYSSTVEEIPADIENAVVLSRFAISGGGEDAGLIPMGGLGILQDERDGVLGLTDALKRLIPETMTLIVASSHGQAERIKQVLMDGGIVAPIIDMKEVPEYEGAVFITVGQLSSGMFLPGLLILTEEELFGGRPPYRAIKKSKVSGLLKVVEDLVAGDFVVHRDFGIGKFGGLVRQEVEGGEYELMALDYADGDRLYLPLYSIDRIRKYRSKEGALPKIEKLGTGAWQKTKERVGRRIKDMAEKLLKIYAARELAEGEAFSPDTELHREFDSFFPYEETPDQLRAIEEIKRDMESPKPMDRLLCGDVGYGKTEVAMRAAFKAVFDGKQAAVLVPTTLLCEQHLRIFRRRFSAFPVKIDYLSRFKQKKERDETLKAVAKGKVDILIATHSLISKKVAFYDLGLLIIDEEHRFGVRQKESLRELKRGVDILALSATPIPRTLQMAISGIRKLSVIETPPEERLAVKSSVAVFGEEVIRAAIGKELERGGQVFFVHNRIHDIDKVALYVKRAAPQARLAIAHGQMPERELEKIMMSFLNREVDVLVSTAIIGSGLDIPTVNTIIIDMAHKMGLADLYQLKGRVGRSNIKAYAYYLIPGESVIEDVAGKRLRAIQELNYMGAGLRLAMRDLEIRGAGNLLGAEQSGFIEDVGFDMYIEMLEKAVSEMKGEPVLEKTRPTINVRAEAFIPEDYIEDPAVRLGVYREAASVKTFKELDDIESELSDRFGRPPAPCTALLEVIRLGLLAGELDMPDIKQSGASARFTFSGEAAFSANDLQKAFKGRIRFYPDGFELSGMDSLAAIRNALEKLSGIKTGRY